MKRVSTDEVSFGDYLPEECIAADTHTRTWLATQLSVGRAVWIEELIANSENERNTFIADVRAKAAVESPIVGAIYEASVEDGVYFYAYELLPGNSLAHFLANGEKISPELLVQTLTKIAEVITYYESHQIASSPLGLEEIFIDDFGVIRLKNLAISEPRHRDHSLGDMMRIGRLLEKLVDTQQAGATRFITLLSWMRGDDSEQALSWAEVLEFSLQIDHQLTTPAEFAIQTKPIRLIGKKKLMLIASGMSLIAVIFILILPEKKPPVVKHQPYQQQWILIPAAMHQTTDPSGAVIPEFSISASEVTIGQYAEFLETISILKHQNAGNTFDHHEQPKTKISHLPDDWAKLHAAAKSGSIWREHRINLNTPIVGVDWWDAYAYAKWKNAELLNPEQWTAALMAETDMPAQIEISELLPVTEESPDRTANGLLGMAGSVSEWTSSPRPTPDNPLGEKLWVIMGGSYLRPDQGALSREWVSDRMLRRPDLGFRICKKKQ